MKAPIFTDAQKVFFIKQGEGGTPGAEFCCNSGISHATYLNWKKKYAGMNALWFVGLEDTAENLEAWHSDYTKE